MPSNTSALPFTKMQGVGNDFVVIDAREHPAREWSGLAEEICDRHFGIGADGLLVIDRSHVAAAAMRMFNPDGTPDFCGNGLRCVARYLVDDNRRRTEDGSRHSPLTIATLAGVRTATVSGEIVTVDMGEPRFAPEDIPMRVSRERVVDYPLNVLGEKLRVTALSTGTTHTVIFVDELPDDDRFLSLGPAIEHHPLFPERTSIMWTKVDGPSSVKMRIWERGAGETWGCGSGACAAAVAAVIHGIDGGPISVHSKGGTLTVDWSEGSPIKMTGPAEFVFTGEYPLDPEDM